MKIIDLLCRLKYSSMAIVIPFFHLQNYLIIPLKRWNFKSYLAEREAEGGFLSKKGGKISYGDGNV